MDSEAIQAVYRFCAEQRDSLARLDAVIEHCRRERYQEGVRLDQWATQRARGNPKFDDDWSIPNIQDKAR